MTDFWLSKLFYELQSPKAAAEYNANRAQVLDRYPLSQEVRDLVMADDAARLAPLVNPYLLRYYFSYIGMPDAEFMRRLGPGIPYIHG